MYHLENGYGQNITEISSKATKISRNVAFALKSATVSGIQTLDRPRMNIFWGPFLKLRLTKLRKFRGRQPAGHSGDGETQVMLATWSMTLSGHLLRSVGINPQSSPCGYCLDHGDDNGSHLVTGHGKYIERYTKSFSRQNMQIRI